MEAETGLADRSCELCRYFFRAADPDTNAVDIPACQYLLITGRRRPCPAGRGCVVRQEVAKRPRLRSMRFGRGL